MKTSLIDLCSGLPVQFLQYFESIKELNFSQEPNYNYLRKLFRTLLMTNVTQNNMKFDWETENDVKMKEDGSTSTMLTDMNNKRKINQGGRLKTPDESNQLKVIFKTNHSKSMRTTKDDEEFAVALLTTNNEKESFCTSSKSVRVSECKRDEETKKSDDLELEKKIIGKPSPNINIITPPSSSKNILLPSKSLKISKHDMFNKLSTVGNCNTVFRCIDGECFFFLLFKFLLILFKLSVS